MSHSTPSFKALQEMGFYPDILQSISGFMEFMHKKGHCGLGKQIAETYAAGYLTAKAFRAGALLPDASDEFFTLKTSYLEALDSVHKRFGDRLPRHFYDTLGFMVVRTNPTIEERIPDLEHLLPNNMDWRSADAVLHGLPICSRLSFDVQTSINKKTGRILGHACGCKCLLAEMPTCIVDAAMGDSVEIMLEETESFLRHLLGQCFLLHFGLPQGMGPSVKMDLQDLRHGSLLESLVLRETTHI